MSHVSLSTNLKHPYFINTFLNNIYVVNSTNLLVFSENNRLIELKQSYDLSKAEINTAIKSFIVKEYEGYIYLLITTVKNYQKDNLITILIDINNKTVKYATQEIEKTLYIFNSSKNDKLVDLEFYNNFINTAPIISTNVIKKGDNKLNSLMSDLQPSNSNSKFGDALNNSNSNFSSRMMEEADFDNISRHSNNSIDNTDKFKSLNDNNKSAAHEILFYTIAINYNNERYIKSNNLTVNNTLNENNSLEVSLSEKRIYDVPHDPIKAKSIITDPKDIEKLIYLCKNNKLYINEYLIGSEITSFETYEHFLLVTQNSNSPYSTLHILDLTTFDCKTELKPNFDSKALSIRTIERGSVIVGVCQSTVTLQAVRGNLENFNPRLLILNDIKKLIKEKQYKKSYELVRKHKINMNFLYDCNPIDFFNNVAEIIKQIDKPDYLNLIVNSLVNELSEEVLQINTNLRNDKGGIINIKSDEFMRKYVYNKVNLVCEAFLGVLYNSNNRKENNEFNSRSDLHIKYLTTILHIFCKKTPAEYLNAMNLVKSVSTDTADKGLEYLCWIVDANVLYNFALQTYDFELIIMVAKKTQKDPKEYLPYLEKLRNMDSFMMKYTINMDLKNFNQAVIELSKAGEQYFSIVKETVEKHQLYEVCKEIYTENAVEKMKIYSICAENLIKNSKFKEASIFALAANNLETAIYCYYKDGVVDQTLSLINTVTSKGESSKILFDFKTFRGEVNSYEELLNNLIHCNVAKRNVFELDKVFLVLQSKDNYSFLRDISDYSIIKNLQFNIIQGYATCKNWYKAYQLVNKLGMNTIKNDNNKTVTIEEQFLELLKLELDLHRNSILTNETEFNSRLNRLLTVQMEKKENPNLLESYNNNELVYDDNFSETGSVISSGSSHNSQKSKKSNASKLTKKAKNKLSKRNVKEGSPLEEDFLIIILNEIYELIINAAYNNELEEFVNVLFIFNFISEAKEIQSSYLRFKEKLEKTFPVFNVYQQEFTNKNPEIKMIFPNLYSVSTKNQVKK